ncbi:MAG TPA: transposase, partial [Gemmatimonadaceae bacterium]|nr:transposase [Gemmatimonadaceae bacterium]
MAAVDATGLEARHVSAYYRVRRGTPLRRGLRERAWPKLTAVVHTHSHLIVGAVTGLGPSYDSPAFAPAMRQAAALVAFDTVLADAAFDAEHNHRLC